MGKTNMSANLAALAARAGKRVLIVDADLGLANVDIIFGVEPMHYIGDLLQPGVSGMDVLIEAGPNIHILPAGSGVQRMTELDRKDKLRLVVALDGLEDHFDLVIIDSGAGIEGQRAILRGHGPRSGAGAEPRAHLAGGCLRGGQGQ